MRIALAVLLLVHGLVHSLGFLVSWRLAEIPQLTLAASVSLPEPLTRAIGLGWLLACLAFVAAASMLVVRSGPWRIVTAVGVAVSSLLVIHAWPEAKVGALVNIILVIPLAIAWADARFQRETDKRISALLARAAGDDSRLVTSEMLETLPPPVRRWLAKSGAVGQKIPRAVRLEQRGRMRFAPGKNEAPATAQQVFRVHEPEFIWRVRVPMMRVLPVAGRDTYAAGRGRMLIKLASLVPVVDASGEKLDQGALLRYLGESVWFPAASLSPAIRWEPIDDSSAEATMTLGDVSSTAVFSFDGDGRFVRLSADRYFGGGADAELERWEVEATAWDTPDGCLVPVRGEVRWKLAEGDFTFYRWEITKLEYDPSDLLAREKSATP